jgi:hypothetical protein
MSIYDDIKIEKLENLLEWLKEELPKDVSGETAKLIKRVEQQITFLKLPENSRQ